MESRHPKAKNTKRSNAKWKTMIQTVAAAAVGMAIGGAAVYAATQDHRQIRRTVHRLPAGQKKL